MSTKYTKHFSNCKAVFQGGGCKGIAYIGAYKRAYERGVFFTELAGTSAGSIIAALIAVGASPEQMERIVRNTDFMRFMKSLSSPTFKDRLFVRFCAPKEVRRFSNLLSLAGFKKFYGLFDSKEIEAFVEEALYTVSGKRNITFEEIIPDLHIVCSDIKSHKIKVWDKDNTPKESIAKAVGASCSIPIFFTPTNNCYVDGGMLSNLPNFIFSEDPHYNKILCFRNESAESIPGERGLLGYLSSLVETIIDGADSLQKQFAEGAHEIVINTGAIRSIDFPKLQEDGVIDELLNSGEKAMDDFLDSEDVQNTSSISNTRTILHTEEQMHSMVSELSVEDYEEVYVIRENAYWSWILFLSIVKWINAGSIVRVVVNSRIGEKYEVEERARRRMLQAMGCQVIEEEQIPVKGFFFLKKNVWTGIIYEKSDNGFEGRLYTSMLDQQLIASIVKKYSFSNGSSVNSITILECPEDVLLERLRSVPEYKDANLYFEVINLKDLVFMNPMIRALKYRQIQLMFDLYNGQDISKFSSAQLVFPNGKDSIVGPPVVEKHNGVNYLIEGNTRCLFAYRHGIEKLKVVVAEGVSSPLPCAKDERYNITQVLLSDKKLEGADRYNGFKLQYFRHIEAKLRPADTYML